MAASQELFPREDDDVEEQLEEVPSTKLARKGSQKGIKPPVVTEKRAHENNLKEQTTTTKQKEDQTNSAEDDEIVLIKPKKQRVNNLTLESPLNQHTKANESKNQANMLITPKKTQIVVQSQQNLVVI